MPINRMLNYERITANTKNQKNRNGWISATKRQCVPRSAEKKRGLLEGRDLSRAVGTVFLF